jgi:UDP-4-amino-4,6-dideoxy-N-acetyl-beta-L-altrosamine transaminase
MISYGRQDICQDDVDAVVEVLRSDFLTQGPRVPSFEECVASKVGANHGVAVNSATSALHIACLALGLGEGDWLWTSPITFVASANCGLYCGAQVDFVDIDPLTYNLCAKALEEKLIAAEKVGALPAVVVPVHMCGQPCDMKAIHDLSERFGFKIIEDASHAIGGKYRNTYIGSCEFSDITVFSFHPVKIVTTAEGGVAVTNCSELSEKMKLLRSHGITRDEQTMTKEADGPWYYEQIALGLNYRMTDLQAALGTSQMKRLDEFVTRRHSIADIYNNAFHPFPLRVPFHLDDSYSAYHLYVVRLNLEEIQNSHKEVFEALRARGLGVNLHYIPVHLHPYYQNMGFKFGDFPEAEQYYKEAVSLPLYPTMSEQQQSEVIHVMQDVLR